MSKYTDFGNIKTTENQVKKHHSMMTGTEFYTLRSIIRNNKFYRCNHAKCRDYISTEDIRKTFKYFDIIEFNTNWFNNEEIHNRTLIRSKEEFLLDDGKLYNLCLVLSLTTNKIVTAYYNYASDNHEYVNMDRYEDFDICELLEMEE